MSINGDTVVVTHKQSGGWRELLSGAGTRSVSVSAAGIFLGSNAETAIRTHALAGTIENYELSFEDGARMQGRFLVQRLDYRSEEHTSELQSLMRTSYAVFCLKNKKKKQHTEPMTDISTSYDNNYT